jgi:alkylated DNA repair dioxygenase AlkB
MPPVDVMLVLEGGRVGEELGGMALLELGSALAAVTRVSRVEEEDDAARDPASSFAPTWMDDDATARGFTAGTDPAGSVLASVPFPTLDAARAAVARCALTRAALIPLAEGTPAEVAAAVGPARAARCAARAWAPGRRALPRVALEGVAAELRDAGVGRDLVARAPVSAPTTTSAFGFEDDDGFPDDGRAPDDRRPFAAYYLHPERVLASVLAWGLDAKSAFASSLADAPNAMPPHQAFLLVNAARVAPGDVVADPCVGGGAALVAAAVLGAKRVLGADLDEEALDAARCALRETNIFFRPHDDGSDDDEKTYFGGSAGNKAGETIREAATVVLRRASLTRPGPFDWLDGARDPADDRGSRLFVDAIVTDLPYGARSAAIGVGEGPDALVSPGEMLDALLRFASSSLRVGGRVAVWLQKKGPGTGGMDAEDVRRRALKRGFEVERRGEERRKTGVERALYVMTRRSGEDGGATTVSPEAPRSLRSREVVENPSSRFGSFRVRRGSLSFGARADSARRAAHVAHASLRRDESHARCAASRVPDPWRAAWTGDVPALDALGVSPGRLRALADPVVISLKVDSIWSRKEADGKGADAAALLSSPLAAAAGNGRVAAIEWLLGDDDARGTDSDSGDSDSDSGSDSAPLLAAALAKAASFGRVAAAEALLDRGADALRSTALRPSGGCAFHAAAERGRVDVLRALASKTPVAFDWTRAEDASGATPAEAAARRGWASAVAFCLESRGGAGGKATRVDDDSGRDHSAAVESESESSRGGFVSLEEARRVATVAARWGHLDAIRAAARASGLGAAVATERAAAEAARWQRRDAEAYLRELLRSSAPRDRDVVKEVGVATRTPGDPSAPDPSAFVGRRPSVCLPRVPSGATTLFRDDATGALAYYVPPASFCDGLGEASALLAEARREIEAHYLDRDDPLAATIDRRGARRAVPRDQAYFGARYASRERAAGKEASVSSKPWRASYRYNPDRTLQPTPASPPRVIRAVSRRVFEVCGQTCNHAVVNRYRDGADAIGAHADKATDLADGSFVVSVSLGATRTMVFEPRVTKKGREGSGGGGGEGEGSGGGGGEGERGFGGGGEEGIAAASRRVAAAAAALAAALARHPEWRACGDAKRAAPAKSDAKRRAIANEKRVREALRERDPRVAACALAAREARGALAEARAALATRVALEPGSAVFFNMAFNDAWTHAVPAERTDGTRPASSAAGGASERVGITLRRCETVFDPARQAEAAGKSRARRREIWRRLSEMADVDAEEAAWRGDA